MAAVLEATGGGTRKATWCNYEYAARDAMDATWTAVRTATVTTTNTTTWAAVGHTVGAAVEEAVNG